MTAGEYQELVEFLGHKFTALDQGFLAIDRRFNVIDEKFREVLGDFDEIYRRLDRLGQMALLQARIDELEQRIRQ